MHERSLAQSLLRMIEDVLVQERGVAVRAARVEVGEFSGVEPLLLESAFRDVARGTVVEDAAIHWDVVPLTARCESCGAEQAVESFRFVCQGCGSKSLRVTGGDAVRLMNVSIEERGGRDS